VGEQYYKKSDVLPKGIYQRRIVKLKKVFVKCLEMLQRNSSSTI